MAEVIDRIAVLMEDAVKIENERQALNTKRTANRASLRNLYDAGILTDEERAWVDEVYPFSERRKRDPNMPDYTAMSREDLETAVKDAGLTVEGSGKNGSVLKADLVDALTDKWDEDHPQEDAPAAPAATAENGNGAPAEEAATA